MAHEISDPLFRALPPALAASVQSAYDELHMFADNGFLDRDWIVGKRVLDWEAGGGAHAIAFLLMGAREVVAIDSWTAGGGLEAVASHPAFVFEQISIEGYSARASRFNERFDLIFCNTVTEHIQDLPAAFTAINSLLSPDGLFFTNHDNYYSPCGSHDHGFWFYGEGGAITFQGRDCWAHEEKCAVSQDHRTWLLSNMPWTWNERLDGMRTPQDCTLCPYFHRSRTWAHLRAGNNFPAVFDDPSFSTGRQGSSLNKVTPMQLKQLAAEAGLHVVKSHRNRVTNPVEPELLEEGYSELDLTTSTLLMLCRPAAAVAPRLGPAA